MDDFRTSVTTMLRASLAASASVQGISVNDAALDFSSSRATTHIFNRRSTDRARLEDAIDAVRRASEFVTRIRGFFPSERVIVESEIKRSIDERSYDCFYPWCRPQ
jgi:hypothetical protein